MKKTIHYCWFGRGEKPELVRKCIDSWKEYMPEYQLMEWNEDNFDLSINNFVAEAYKDENYSFVSDYVKAYVLYNFGGIYLDTDVEAVASFDSLLENKTFLGFEEGNYITTSVMGTEKHREIMKDYLDGYENLSYQDAIMPDNRDTKSYLLTRLLEERGLKRDNREQMIGDIRIYPKVYFCPYDYINGINNADDETIAIHHFAQLWLPRRQRLKSDIKKFVVRTVGGDKLKKLRRH